ncbi:hypothetical protein ACWCQP_47820 [Streptomyces chartreusis]
MAGSVIGLTLFSAAGVWVYGVYSMSDPMPLLVGLRFDGSRISVKVPTCPTDKVGTVEVYDSDSEKLLWLANHPRTSEGEQGAVTLWKADGFLKASRGTQPKTLPTNLDVSVTYAGGEDGTGETFNIREVQAVPVPEGQYWTYDGTKSAGQIDAQLQCHNRQ